MARLQLDFPDHNFIYTTTLTVRITGIIVTDLATMYKSEAHAR